MADSKSTQVTPAMIEAGVIAYLDNRPTSDDPYDVDAEALVRLIYLAMASAEGRASPYFAAVSRTPT